MPHKAFWKTSLAALVLLPSLSVLQLQAEDGVRPNRDQVRSQLRQHSTFVGAQAALPSAFQVQYSLRENANVSVTLLDLNRMPLRTFHIRAGEPGAMVGENELSIWDGKDGEGDEMPTGDYWAAVSIQYTNGVDNKRFRLVKP